MEKEEADSLLNSIYPEGKERWMRVLIHNRNECVKIFRYGVANENYEITAVGVKDEHVPQVSAIADIEDDVMILLVAADVSEGILNDIRSVFRTKKEELKGQTILPYP